MAGHSKWANIKHRKGRQDAARGKLFAKLARAIESEARKGGGDPEANYALAAAVAKAKAASMPGDNIIRAIKRGTGETGGVAYVELWYEGYAPGGVAVYVQVLTDNRRRAASDVRTVFTRNGGSLGRARIGRVSLPAQGADRRGRRGGRGAVGGAGSRCGGHPGDRRFLGGDHAAPGHGRGSGRLGGIGFGRLNRRR